MKIATIIIGLFLLFWLGIAISRSQRQFDETPEQNTAQAKANDEFQKIVAGAMLLRKSMRNPESFRLQSAYFISDTETVCYAYRAQNGFGGMNSGNAVMIRWGERFLTNDMPGFTRLWNKECANKSGNDKARLVNTAMKYYVTD